MAVCAFLCGGFLDVRVVCVRRWTRPLQKLLAMIADVLFLVRLHGVQKLSQSGVVVSPYSGLSCEFRLVPREYTEP